MKILFSPVLLFLFGNVFSTSVTNEQIDRLKSLFDNALVTSIETMKTRNVSKIQNNIQVMGPGVVSCYTKDEKLIYESEFGLKKTDVVGLRSLSKIIVATTVMMLQERNLVNINERVGDTICGDTPVIANSTFRELLSMSSLGFDGRANALRSGQLKRRKFPTDHVGWPPLCDELDYNPTECISKFICPLYKNDPEVYSLTGFTIQDIETAPDLTCAPFDKVARKKCLNLKLSGACENDFRFMVSQCQFACPGSGCSSTVEMKQMEDVTGSTRRWHYSYDENLDKIVKQRKFDFVYDNYGYTMIDAVVKEKTGKFLFDWIETLIFTPLQMKGSLKCLYHQNECTMEENSSLCKEEKMEESYQCLSPADTVEVWALNNFTIWKNGSLSKSWISNALAASSVDFRKFLAMLLRNGTYVDEQTGKETKLLSKESVDTIFYPHFVPTRPMGECVGTQAFGLGVGYCKYREHAIDKTSLNLAHFKSSNMAPNMGRTLCSSEDSWLWASSYGSRISLIRDQGIACTFFGNQPCIHAISTRNHIIGHNMSAFLREVFPLNGS